MRTQFFKWFPAFAIMLVVFIFSAQPGSELLDVDWADRILKKGGHIIGYALLALSYWRAFHFKEEKRRLAWLLAVLYAVTDEFHQSFVPGRNPSIWDVVIFDNFGALISLWTVNFYKKQKRPDWLRPVVEQVKR